MNNKKITTGLKGLDTVLNGGYPAVSPTLLKGGPGSGKTVFSLSFAHGQLQQENSVVIATCDESPKRLIGYMDSFGMAGTEHLASGKLTILDFRPNLHETVVGEYDLSPILLRISHAIESSNAQVLVIDSLQNLLLGLGVSEPRMEVLELFDWIRDKGIATLVTMSASEDNRQSGVLEEYAVDCVIHLSQKIDNLLMTRYLRVLKMRGSAHGSNSYPFSLNHSGVSLLPITATRLDEAKQSNRYSSGIPRIDEMLGGEGYFKGTSLMISGRSGSGKTILASTLLNHVLVGGGKAIYVSFEESQRDLIRNLQSVGIDLSRYNDTGQLLLHSGRAIEMGLEDHLISIIDLVDKESPELLVLDPVSGLMDMGSSRMVKMLMIRFITHIKEMGSTLVLTELLPDASDDYSDLAISSLVDTWFKLRQVESNGELNRMINVVKSRGSNTSNQVKEFSIGEKGIKVEDPYIGEGEVVVGSARITRIQQEQEEADRKRYELEQVEHALSTLQAAYLSKQQILEADFESEKREMLRNIDELKRQASQIVDQRNTMQKLRD
jgi:circadian clock protein KaiC